MPVHFKSKFLNALFIKPRYFFKATIFIKKLSPPPWTDLNSQVTLEGHKNFLADLRNEHQHGCMQKKLNLWEKRFYGLSLSQMLTILSFFEKGFRITELICPT